MPVRFLTPSRATFVIVTAVLVSTLNIFFNVSVIDQSCHQSYLDVLLNGPVSQTNYLLLDWIKKQLVPPSKEDYNIKYMMSGLHQEAKHGVFSKVYSPSQEFILGKVEEIAEQMPRGKRGFFVEAGAYDGEFLSNTLTLEIYYGWRGLLVEANPTFFNELITKNRKAWAINVCLNTKPWPTKEMFLEAVPDNSSEHMLNARSDPVLEEHTNLASSGLSSYARLYDKSQVKEKFEVQCLPLYSILRALNIRHVDFLSLDVERAEMAVLETIPWDEISFTLLAIEHPTPTNLTKFLQSKGYAHWESFSEDHVYINDRLAKVTFDKGKPSARSKSRRIPKGKSFTNRSSRWKTSSRRKGKIVA